jgi:hypothetical protein
MPTIDHSCPAPHRLQRTLKIEWWCIEVAKTSSAMRNASKAKTKKSRSWGAG